MQKTVFAEDSRILKPIQNAKNVETPGLGRSPKKEATKRQGLKARSIDRI
jgi:hypothetical protein